MLAPRLVSHPQARDRRISSRGRARGEQGESRGNAFPLLSPCSPPAHPLLLDGLRVAGVWRERLPHRFFGPLFAPKGTLAPASAPKETGGSPEFPVYPIVPMPRSQTPVVSRPFAFLSELAVKRMVAVST